ncbi:MAG TPA: LysR family transcriptional regulator [Polyangiaceae bacterium]|nr:LysR family transcriptional regulator [Polyangiaceae bacterium]
MLLTVIMSNTNEAPLDLDLLAALDLLLDERSVTRAARRLGVTPSAMSHKLRALRERLDDPLLVGGRAGLVPTARAEAMAAPLRQALSDVRAAVRAGATFEPRSSKRRFVIATVDYVEFRVIPRALKVLRREAPGISIAIEPPGPRLGARLESGAVDLAIGAASVPATGTLLRRSLGREGFVVLGRAGHPGLRRPLTLASYAALSHVLISPGGTPGGPVDDLLARHGLKREAVLCLSHFVTAPFLAARSDLVVTAPVGLANEARRYLELTIVPAPPEIAAVESHMVWHPRSQHDPAHRWLRELVERQAQTLAAESTSAADGGGPRRWPTPSAKQVKGGAVRASGRGRSKGA